MYGYTFICSLLDTKPDKHQLQPALILQTSSQLEFKSSSFYNSILLTNDYYNGTILFLDVCLD